MTTTQVHARARRLLLALPLAAVLASHPAAACTVGTGSGGSCTEAALDACLPSGGGFDGTVTFSCGGAATITVTGTKTISADTTIDGGGLVTISGGHAVAVFVVSAVTFTVQNLTIANGQHATSGSAIQNGGTTTATSCTFSGNTGGNGGAIRNSATLTVTGCAFTGNTGTSGGGALYNDGTLTVTDSTFTGNTGTTGANGGAIENAADATITRCTFSGNTTTAGGNGGAIYDAGSTLTITDSTISGNTAGGGGNGGGVYTQGSLTLGNCTITGNTAAVNGDGGGIYNDSDGLSVVNCTVTGNTAGNSGGGVYFNGDGTLTNTIVAHNTASDADTNCANFFGSDGGHNIDDGTSCGFTGSGCSTTTGTSFCNSDPLLDSAGLVDHGGPTKTIGLESQSPAIDHGDAAACAAAPVGGVDQRGVARPQPAGGQCDIGAFEVQAGIIGSTTTTTTTPTTTTTTTTVPGQCGAPAPTFASVDCRLEALIRQVHDATDLGKVQRSLLQSATRARDKKVAAEQVASTNPKAAKKRLKVALRKMTSFNFRIRSLVARKTIPAATRQSLADQGTRLQQDMKTLLKTLRGRLGGQSSARNPMGRTLTA